MKKLFFLSLIISTFSCSKNQPQNFNLNNFLSDDAEIIVISSDFKEFIQSLNQNEFIHDNDFALKETIQNRLGFLSYLTIKNKTAISFSNIKDKQFEFAMVTQKDSALIDLKSIKNKSVETVEYKGLEYKKFNLEGEKFILHETENAVIISNSIQQISAIRNGENRLKDESFDKAYAASNPDKSSVFIKNNVLEKHLSSLFSILGFDNITKIGRWTSVDLDLSNSQIIANGISLGKGKKDIQELFSKNPPNVIESIDICPADFISFYAFSFSDYKKLHQASTHDSIESNYPAFLNYSQEIATINLQNGKALIINTPEIELAKESLAGFGSNIENFREIEISQLENKELFKSSFPSLISPGTSEFYCVIDHFIIFSEEIDVVREIISANQNSSLIVNKTYFSELLNSLSSQSSLLFIAKVPEFISQLKKDKTENNKTTLRAEKNSLAALQIVQEDNFAHIHGVFSNTSISASQSLGVEQTLSLNLDNTVATTPVFFKNHRTDQMDIVVQDEKNILYLISNKGTIFWKKQLKSRINSTIYQVDLFKNGNKQLAFSTDYSLQILDRNGNTVKPFPIQFNDELTQPLSVFDYDNNRNYRFVLTQKKSIYMLGPKGKPIKGFDFEKANSNIIQSPKHIRLGNKDYILIAEESGRLNILSRQGNIRVPLANNIDFSENHWFGFQDKFITTDSENNLVTINQMGAISKKTLNLAENNQIIADDENFVSLSENELSINGKIVNLDFGLYTNPQIFKIKKQVFIGITDTQTQKVYVFNGEAELLEGFPVYGTSQMDILNADIDSKRELVVKGEGNEILIYEF